MIAFDALRNISRCRDGDCWRMPSFCFSGLALPVFVDTVTALVAAARRGMRRNAVTCCAARKDNTEVGVVVAASRGDVLFFLQCNNRVG